LVKFWVYNILVKLSNFWWFCGWYISWCGLCANGKFLNLWTRCWGLLMELNLIECVLVIFLLKFPKP
jgi:hypothetical protein